MGSARRQRRAAGPGRLASQSDAVDRPRISCAKPANATSTIYAPVIFNYASARPRVNYRYHSETADGPVGGLNDSPYARTHVCERVPPDSVAGSLD